MDWGLERSTIVSSQYGGLEQKVWSKAPKNVRSLMSRFNLVGLSVPV